MNTPFEVHGHPLPPIGDSHYLIHLLRKNRHFTLHIVDRHTGEPAGTFTLHRAETLKLVERLGALTDAPDGSTNMVEGVHLGGPPRKDQLVGDLLE